jgi:hypothetical protein
MLMSSSDSGHIQRMEPMQRARQILFVAALLALSWLGMMAVHELGHVIGAVVTGGSVQRCVLHPLTISRTDVSPNPHPVAVVWMGPIVGGALPLVALACVPPRFAFARRVAQFFAGFCLIANGAYLAVGWIDRVGDCGEMLRNGVPVWWLWAFGGVAMAGGLYLWHRLGSMRHFLDTPSLVTRPMAYGAAVVLAVIIAIECATNDVPPQYGHRAKTLLGPQSLPLEELKKALPDANVVRAEEGQ